MVKIYFQKNSKVTTVSNRPMMLGKKKGIELEIPDEDYSKIVAGTHTLDIDGSSNPVITEIPPRPESDKEKAKKALKDKLDEGTATDADVKEGLKLLLS